MGFDVLEVEEQIKIPVHEWPGNCFAIACAMINMGVVKNAKAKVRYGHYLGEVKPGNRFSNRSIIRHGWIELVDGSIIDPTRWVFENAHPYIYEGPNHNEYDAGGNVLRESRIGEPPENDLSTKQFELDVPTHVHTFLYMILDNVENTFSIEQLLWIANLPPSWLDPHTKDVYLALAAIGQKALIPIDNWKMIMK